MSQEIGSQRPRSRRDLLLAGRGSPVHIVSLLVQAWPDRVEEIASTLGEKSGLEAYPTEAPGRLIVTVEAESDGALVDAMSLIGDVDGVLSTSLVFHQLEEVSDGA